MSRLPNTPSAPVRWRDDTGWEMRCDSCALSGAARFWPLTKEFWNPKQMSRCRACENRRKAQTAKLRRRTDEALRRRDMERNRRYRQDCRDAIAVKRREYKREWMRRHRGEQAA